MQFVPPSPHPPPTPPEPGTGGRVVVEVVVGPVVRVNTPSPSVMPMRPEV